ncbi:MAG: hypothetical protein IJK22_07305 [Bacteroidales bacterium]|jgi:hypothetical protein|nr:hypothetical protein [Bacteroidales bacterium]
MKKGTYKTKKLNSSEVNEPVAAYAIPPQSVATNDKYLPDGYMSLEQFGEIFHQKLNACYENVQSDRQ